MVGIWSKFGQEHNFVKQLKQLKYQIGLAYIRES